MHSTGLFSGFLKSFYSKPFYREVSESWRGRSFLYLFILLAVCWFFLAFVNTMHLKRFVEVNSHAISTQMPVIHFESGVASTSKPGPFYIKSTDDQKVFIVIDTGKQIKDFRATQAWMLIGPHSIRIKTGKSAIDTHYYPKHLSITVDPQIIKQNLTKSMKWTTPFVYSAIYISGLAFSYVYRFIQVLIYALIGLIFVAILKRKLDYVAMINLSIIAITPAIVLDTLASLFKFHFSFEFIPYFLLSMGYLFYAVKANRQCEM